MPPEVSHLICFSARHIPPNLGDLLGGDAYRNRSGIAAVEKTHGIFALCFPLEQLHPDFRISRNDPSSLDDTLGHITAQGILVDINHFLIDQN